MSCGQKTPSLLKIHLTIMVTVGKYIILFKGIESSARNLIVLYSSHKQLHYH